MSSDVSVMHKGVFFMLEALELRGAVNKSAVLFGACATGVEQERGSVCMVGCEKSRGGWKNGGGLDA